MFAATIQNNETKTRGHLWAVFWTIIHIQQLSHNFYEHSVGDDLLACLIGFEIPLNASLLI